MKNACTKLIVTTLLLGVVLTPATISAQQVVPGQQSALYYKIGGGEPLSRAANPSSTPLRIGLGGSARLNYSCGKFDAEISIANLMNTFSTLGTQITGAVRAGIASLPMYIFQRAAPGLYELFQTYRRKAEVEFGAALKTCEEMEAVIRNGGDPYEDWIKMAKGENWKTEVNTNRDGVVAKANVERNAGRDGVTWIGGTKKGGFSQGPIEVVRDIVVAGYNVTMNQAPAASPTAVFPSTGPGATRLTQAFLSPSTAADWAVAVMGDKLIATCDEVGCPAKGSSPGTGLLPKFEAEKPLAQTQLLKVVSANVPERADLEAASAPGVAMTRELVDAIREMRPLERDIALGRLSMEVAQARIIDRALLIRNTFLTGAGVPEATYDAAQKEVRAKVDEINRYIDDLLFETRVRREVVSNTASALIDSHRANRAASMSTGTKGRVDPNPLLDGRVK